MRKLVGAILLNAVLMIPVPVFGREGPPRYHRYYDRDARDWHEWNEREARAYRHYLEERRERYREYIRLKRAEQRAYWRWRHTHPDTVLFR
jgi:hypothetical protein